MGRHSDSDEEYSSRRLKKKTRRSRSRSSSVSSKHSSKHKKSKKSKTKYKKRSRSRSISRDRSRRSRSKERRSRSRDRRSKSRDRRSRSRGRKSRSPVRNKNSHSRDQYRKRSRSDSRGRYRSRSRSRTRRSRSHDRHSGDEIQGNQIPGFDKMTPGEQANARMRLALKAAAAADEKILGHSSQTDKTMSYLYASGQDSTFTDAVEDIESASFVSKAFTSTRSNKPKTEEEQNTHEKAIFGSGTFEIKTDLTDKKNFFVEPDSYAHPNLYCNPEEKMTRWIQKLTAMRKRNIEGDVY